MKRLLHISFTLAQAGNPEAARYVGIMKFSGKGTAKSISEARQWLSVAAQKGDKMLARCLKNINLCFVKIS